MTEIPTIKVKRLPHARDLPLPTRATIGSSGCDLCAALAGTIRLRPGERKLIPTGLRYEIPQGYEVQVRSRSGLAFKQGIAVLNSPGTIDADYRGEVCVILINHGAESVAINHGDRIAQAVPLQVAPEVSFIEVDKLEESQRGSGGFGSTGS
ncbi:MAG: dUTP diphosphatase [Chitinivibrionales bacterium]|nr:dUTP diphosphatase [Chitinivibrionales bacterium]